MAEVIYNSSIHDVLPNRFLEYATSILQERAIPDGFDGLKPIHRRVLMAMKDLNLKADSPHRKSAKTVGQIIGVYSPHGDQSAYEALVGMAQDFNMRYPLVDGSGNFGDVNGNTAAAMRYTESRLSPVGELMLEDVDKLSAFKDNFDNSTQEPITLSSYWPNLLCNPQTGIAVGLATKFAPHYAKDVYNALIKAVEFEAKGKDISLEELIDIIQAPDFPTGAQIINGNETRNIYRTGKGPVTLRAKYKLEKNNIVYYEIPYKVTPKSILEKIASLNIDDIRDVRDESSLQNGMRIVVELKKGANPEYIINRLFKDTDLQCNYNVNMVAIMDNRPKAELNLKEIVSYYIDHLKVVHRKALTIRKEELEQKIFVINTLLKAIDNIEEIIRIVRYEDEPILEMQKQLGFTKEEAEYIYQIKIAAISKANKLDLDAKKELYEAELSKLAELLSKQVAFLGDLGKKLKSIRDHKIFKEDVRRTEVLNLESTDSLEMKDFVKKEPVTVIYTSKGQLKSIKTPENNGKNVIGIKTKIRDDEYVLQAMNLDTHSDLLLFSDLGKAFILPVYKVPVVGKNAPGKSVNNYLTLEDEEKIILLSAVPENKENLSAVLVTAGGFAKRTELELLTKTKSSVTGFKAIGLEEDDKVVGVNICKPNSEIAVFTVQGRGLKFNIDDDDRPVRSTGKTSKGVQILKLQDDERIVAVSLVDSNNSIFLMTVNGYGKRLNSKMFKDQKRNQTPIQYMSKFSDDGRIIAAVAACTDEDIIITTKQGQVLNFGFTDFKAVGRMARGLEMVDIKDDMDSIVNMATVCKDTLDADDVEPVEDIPEIEQQSLF